MARRTYGEDERKTVKRSINDKELLESFMAELGVPESSRGHLEMNNPDQDISGVASYRLIHPYEAGNFPEYLMRGEQVTARVELEVEGIGRETEVYEGHVTYDAAEIFNPGEVFLEDEKDESEENMREEIGTRKENVASVDSRSAQVD